MEGNHTFPWYFSVIATITLLHNLHILRSTFFATFRRFFLVGPLHLHSYTSLLSHYYLMTGRHCLTPCERPARAWEMEQFRTPHNSASELCLARLQLYTIYKFNIYNYFTS